jgi:hypothetical protein
LTVNGLIESTNTKIRLLTRMAFGFAIPCALIALACSPSAATNPPSPAAHEPPDQAEESKTSAEGRLGGATRQQSVERMGMGSGEHVRSTNGRDHGPAREGASPNSGPS